MSFIQSISKVVELANTVVMEDKKLHEKHGLELGISLGAPSTQEYLKDAKGLRDNLNEYLNSLSEEVVTKLETVMYFGRDSEDVHGNDLPALHKQLHPSKLDKADSIRNIGEKTMSLEIYFNSAKDKAEQLSIDLENII